MIERWGEADDEWKDKLQEEEHKRAVKTASITAFAIAATFFVVSILVVTVVAICLVRR